MASILGESAWIFIGSKNPEQTAFYFDKMGFRFLVSTGSAVQEQVWMHNTDVGICITYDERERLGLLYTCKLPKNRFDQLKALGFEVQWRSLSEDCFQLNQFSEIHIRVQTTPELPIFTRQTPFHDLPDETKNNAFHYNNLPLGAFGELTINTTSLDKMIDICRSIGFNIKLKTRQPYPWCLLSDGLVSISLLNSKILAPPSLVFYAENRPQTIRQLREKQIQMLGTTSLDSLADENVVLATPDGHYIHLLQV